MFDVYNEEKDWVCREIKRAKEKGKNIIPILTTKFDWEKEKNKDIINILKSYNNIRLTQDLFDGVIARLEKFLKSPKYKKWSRKKTAVCSIASVICLLLIFLVGRVWYIKNLPTFSLGTESVSQEDDWNLHYVIANNGGNIANGNVVPHFVLDLVVKGEKEETKYGHLTIEISDFFSKSYSFDTAGDSVNIKETKAEAVLAYLLMLDEQLSKKNIHIETYALQTYFEITYTDFLKINHKERYATENNYDFIFVNKDGYLRYCANNAIVRVNEIPESYVEFPISSTDISTLAKQTCEDICNDYKEIFVHNSDRANGGIVVQSIDCNKVSSLIEDENNLVIGYHVTHKHCNGE